MDEHLLKEAFEMSARAAAAMHDVDPGMVAAPSRGRGYKPPIEVVGARKLALWLTVTITGCQYAELARVAGLHRDTVCSHCADVRDLSFEDDVEELAEALRVQLVKATTKRVRRWRAKRATEVAKALLHPTSSDDSSDTRKKVEGAQVIPLARARA